MNGADDNRDDDPGQQEQSGANENNAAQISTSFFPPPPQVYKRFTKRNLRLLQVLNSHPLVEGDVPWDQLDFQQRLERQNRILSDHLRRNVGPNSGDEMDEDQRDDEKAAEEYDLPDFDLKLELEPPNVDLIEQDGGYTVFGQLWPIPDVTPTLEELGIPVLYPRGNADRKELLVSLLQTLLQTYREITADLLEPAQPYDVWVPAVPDPNLSAEQQQQQQQQNPGFWTQSTQAKDRLKHIQNVVVNMQFLINELRPVQAKETLKLIMQMQLDRRRNETKLIQQ